MTKKNSRLLVYISGHGYGHVAQLAPILNLLQHRLPQLEVIVKTAVPNFYLSKRIQAKFRHVAEASDFGMVMASALEVLPQESMQAYREFHIRWDERVDTESQTISELSPDVVLSNIAYLPLAAAARAGIPSVAMCSLDWADIFRHYCRDMPDAAGILRQMEEAYAQSQAFLRLTPSMPMPWVLNGVDIGPVAQPGKNRREEINRQLGLPEKGKLVLVSMGGVSTRLPVETWPTEENIVWLLQSDWLQGVKRSDMLALESLGTGFADIFASCDLMLTKPGYGTFVEAACSGIPVLYVERDGWPEQPCLIEWLHENGLGWKLDAKQVRTGDFAWDIQLLLSQPKPKPVNPTGVDEAAGYLANLLG